MDQKIGLFAWLLAGFAILIGISVYVLKGGLFNYARALALLLPFVFILLINVRSHWHVLILAFVTAESIVIPVYGLNKLTIEMLLLSAVAFTLVLDYIIKKPVREHPFYYADRLVFCLGIIFAVRFLYDRPGFVGLGMETGGLVNSIYYTIAPWFYFAVRAVFARARLTRQQLWAVLFVSAITNVAMLHFAPSLEYTFWGRKVVNAPAWLFCATALALVISLRPGLKKWFLFYSISFGMLGLGLISNYRSRTLFFAAEILLIAYFAKIFKQAVIVLIIGGVLGTGAMYVAGGGRLPRVVNRAISIFMDVEKTDYTAGGAYGWEDTFRRELYQIAWGRIRENPIVGSGFGLNVQEALQMLSTFRTVTYAELVAHSGNYHNSVLEIAVRVGLPAAVIFSIFYVVYFLRFFKTIESLEGVDKTWAIAITAFWAANTGMMLMNGGPKEYFVSMVICGIMAGLTARTLKNSTAPAEAPRAVATPPANVGISLSV
ncbi:MAG TPA: hypothetical protein PKK36_11065 [Kiritimatiellia bacterium]|nr:hypothetical protein [Kiritimatiellia bacterium]HNR95133.1 hypothetical protein [Kiritimatiellia bacterium]